MFQMAVTTEREMGIPTRWTVSRAESAQRPLLQVSVGPGGSFMWRAPQWCEIYVLETGSLVVSCEPDPGSDATAYLHYATQDGRYFLDSPRWSGGAVSVTTWPYDASQRSHDHTPIVSSPL